MQPNINFKLSESSTELTKALFEIQKNIGKLYKNTENPFHKSKYADLTAVLSLAKDQFNEHGILLIQTAITTEGRAGVITRLTHNTSGEWLETTLLHSCPKSGPQPEGACITYARRYSLLALLGLAQEDSDGEGAMLRKTQIKAEDALYAAKQFTSQGKLKDYINSLDPDLVAQIKPELKPIWNNFNVPVQNTEVDDA